VTALSIFYGQRHERELQSAKAIAELYGVKHYEFDLSEVFRQSGCALLKNSLRQIEHRSYFEQMATSRRVSTYVPFRNGLMLSAAASIAGSISENEPVEIYIGVHADDAANNAYADCSEKFIQTLNEAIKIGTYRQISIVAPFVGKMKSEVVKIGLELKTPYQLTWSCYEGGDKPCGQCATCIDRARAFESNGVKDPAED
jgi:7-cyano-7-deazaguanine synthase